MASKLYHWSITRMEESTLILTHYAEPVCDIIHSEKKWSQNGASEEPFWKTAPLWQRGAIFFFIFMFMKWLHVTKRSQNGATKGSVLWTRKWTL